MNEHELLKAMSNIDESYIAEAEYPVSIKKTNKPLIRILSILAAAAAMTTTAGAISSVFLHRETVENYLYGDSRKMLEEQELVCNYMTANEHVQLTVETILSDGHLLYLIATLEPLDEEAQNFIAEHGSFPLDLAAIYDDTGEKMNYIGQAGFCSENGNHLIECSYWLKDIDITRPAEMCFSLRKNQDSPEIDFIAGLTIPLDMTPNLESIAFSSDAGDIVYLSEFALCSDTINCITNPNYRIFLIKNNGFRVEINDDFNLSGLSSKGGMGTNLSIPCESYCMFDKLISVTDYDAIEINGVIYKR